MARNTGTVAEQEKPITATGYDANGEAQDVPVEECGIAARDLVIARETPTMPSSSRASSSSATSDTRPAPALPGMEPESDRTKLDLFREGKATLLLVEVEPGDVSMAESTEDGHTKGVFHKRKLHVVGVYAAEDIEGSEALFEGGLLRVRKGAAPECDGIGFLTEEPIPDSDNPLADALAEAMPLEPGMCGETHAGHLNPCRQPAHACPLRGG